MNDDKNHDCKLPFVFVALTLPRPLRCAKIYYCEAYVFHEGAISIGVVLLFLINFSFMLNGWSKV